MSGSFNVALVVGPLDPKTVLKSFKEEAAFDVSLAHIYTKDHPSTKVEILVGLRGFI